MTSLSLTDMWLLYFDDVARAFAFTMCGFVCCWLLSCKGIGHKKLVRIVMVFCVVMATNAVAAAINMYFHGRSTVTWRVTLSTLAGCLLGYEVVKERFDLRRTLTRTEAHKVLEVEKMLNDESHSNLKQAIVQANIAEGRKLRQQQQQMIDRD